MKKGIINSFVAFLSQTYASSLSARLLLHVLTIIWSEYAIDRSCLGHPETYVIEFGSLLDYEYHLG